MRISTVIALLVTSVVLTACASNISTEAELMKPKMTDTKMMKKDASCHEHSTNSMTKSASHCHKSNQADHSHKYGG